MSHLTEGDLGPWFIHPFEKAETALHYIVLRPSFDAAIERCRSRSGDTLTDPEVITALHKQFSMLGDFENHVIETVGHSPDDTLAAVRAALVSGQERGDYEQFVQMFEKENGELNEKLKQVQEENSDLRARLQLSQDNLRAIWRTQEVEAIGAAEPLPQEEVEPDSVEETVRKARSGFTETLAFLDSAFSSAQDSPFKQPKRVSQALLGNPRLHSTERFFCDVRAKVLF